MDQRWGAAGITLASGIAAGVEYLLLRHALGGRIGPTRLDGGTLGRVWGAALGAGGVAWAIRGALPEMHPIGVAVIVLGVFGAVYLGGAAALGVPQARRLLRR